MKKILLLVIIALSTQTIKAQADAFITTWVTAGFETLTLPAQPDAPNYTINWGDGSATNTYNATQVPSHFYIDFGEHTISFTGTFPHLTFRDYNISPKLKAVQQWGTQKWTSMANMFQYCSNLNSFPTQSPDLSLCTDMSSMFLGASSFNQPIGSWNVGNVTNMGGMFASATAFNQPIGTWNVSNVTDMSSMFEIAFAFNQPIGTWNVSNVTDMSLMFSSVFGDTSFNQPIDSWNVSQVTIMAGMFFGATSFNQPIGAWNVSKVTNMDGMFGYATAFNQPIGTWNVSNVTDMGSMFEVASAFNQNIGSWDVSKVTVMEAMFFRSKLSTANYDATLIGWATRGTNGGILKQGVYFDGGNSTYCNGLGARNYLINTYGWTIRDAGLDCSSLGTDAFDKSSVSLYPNPTLNILNIKANDNLANQPYIITDALGKVILKGKLNEGDTGINVEHLSKGIYYLKVADKNASKFIKE
jgi:surface protein